MLKKKQLHIIVNSQFTEIKCTNKSHRFKTSINTLKYIYLNLSISNTPLKLMQHGYNN